MNRTTTRFSVLLLLLLLIVAVFTQRLWKQPSARVASVDPAARSEVKGGRDFPPALEADSRRSAMTSPSSWRPAAVFAEVGVPAPQHIFPRGVDANRRYHEVTSQDIVPELAVQAPSVLAKSPEDGRFQLLPNEIDEHTLLAGRLVFNPAALDQVIHGKTSRVMVPTLTDEVLTLEFEKIKTRSANTHTLQGHVAGEKETSTAQIVYHDGILHGNVMRYDTHQELEYRILSDGYMMVRELDHPSMTDECTTCSDHIMASIVDENVSVDEGEYMIRTTDEIVPKATAGWRTVDVVVGYGQEARIADGGYAQIEARIIDAVDRVTGAFANSGIADAELMLLGTIEDPDYRYSDTSASNMGLEISALRTTNGSDGGALDTVTDFTAQLGGDLTSFVILAGRGGVAGVQSADKYTIVSRTNMTPGRMTFAHEIGHCLGAGHAWGDTSNAVDSSRYAWRFTAPDDGNDYMTITSYNNGIGGITIPYYSNPNIFYKGAPTGAVAGYDLSTDPNATGDPLFIEEGGIRGFDGSNPNLGANNAGIIDNGNPTDASSGLAYNSAHDTRTDFEVISPIVAARWEKGTTEMIQFNGGDMQDLATIELYKGGVLHTTLASDVNPATHRNFEWTIPYGQADGTDYMIRVALTSNGSTLTADSGIFEIYSDLPHVKAQFTQAVPAGVGVVTQLELTFNVPMDPASFSQGSDIVAFTDPDGTSVVSAISATSWSAQNTLLTIEFPPFANPGTYQLVLGPDIEDTVGSKMDQDLDGTVGESVDDRYTASFTVNPPLIHYANMDTDPGWTFSANNPVAGWAYGPPTGGTGYSNYGINDPSSGYDGPNVIGYNLGGDYERGITSTRWATTPALDCSSYQNVTLRFQRWLGVYYGSAVNGDYASIEVSNDGTNWTTVWNNDLIRLDEAKWVEVEYDISAVADGQPTVYVRWGMGKTNSSLNDDSCGWNIDEVIVFGDVLDGILLFSPNGGESYYAGSTVNFRWASTLGGNVKIELVKNGLVDSTITTSTPNDGSYDWQIPAGQAAGSDYRIRVSSLDDPSKTAESAADFTLVSILVTSPNGGESYYSGATANLTWESSMGGNVKIELLKNGSVDSTITSSTANDGSYTWQVPAAQSPGADYGIRITSLDVPAGVGQSAANFTIISIRVTSPNGGENYYVGSTADLTWASSLGGNVQIELLKDGSVDSMIISSTANDGSYAWPIPTGQAPGANYRIRVTSLDGLSRAAESVADFAINARPSVPYSENFVVGFGDWEQESTDDIDWTWKSGGTASAGTGPSTGQGGSGDYYLYTESTGNSNKLARISCLFDLRAVTVADFSFYYHMYGATMGTLLVEASTDGLVWTELFTRSGDQGNAWIQATVSLNAFTGDYAKIRISGTTGSSYTSDIAVDSFTITGSGVSSSVHHFAISAIASPQTAGAPITGITITAQDASNATATSFNGTVNFEGTAGVTGLSASFENGVLSGVSVTPMNAGTDLTLTVDDGAGHLGSVTFTVQSTYGAWAIATYANPFSDTLATSNPDGDSLNNLQEFAFGMDPTTPLLGSLAFVVGGDVTAAGTPAVKNFASVGQSDDFRAVFARRKDHAAAGLTYTVLFSADLSAWTSSAATPTRLTGENSNGSMEAVSIPFPASVPLQAGGSAAPKFFRVGTSLD